MHHLPICPKQLQLPKLWAKISIFYLKVTYQTVVKKLLADRCYKARKLSDTFTFHYISSSSIIIHSYCYSVSVYYIPSTRIISLYALYQIVITVALSGGYFHHSHLYTRKLGHKEGKYTVKLIRFCVLICLFSLVCTVLLLWHHFWTLALVLAFQPPHSCLCSLVFLLHLCSSYQCSKAAQTAQYTALCLLPLQPEWPPMVTLYVSHLESHWTTQLALVLWSTLFTAWTVLQTNCWQPLFRSAHICLFLSRAYVFWIVYTFLPPCTINRELVSLLLGL